MREVFVCRELELWMSDAEEPLSGVFHACCKLGQHLGHPSFIVGGRVERLRWGKCVVTVGCEICDMCILFGMI